MLLFSCRSTAIYRPLASLQRWSLDLVHYVLLHDVWPNQKKKLFAYQVQILRYSSLILLGEMEWRKIETTYAFHTVTISFVSGRLEDGSTNSHNHRLCFFHPCHLPVFQHTIIVKNGLKNTSISVH